MPSIPTINDVHINRPLTNLSIQLMNDASEFMGYWILPRLAVSKWSDQYFIYNSADFLRDDMQPRAPGGLFPEVGYGVSTGQYLCREWALGVDVPDEIRDNTDVPLDADIDAMNLLTAKILIAHERRVASLVTATANITQNKTGVASSPTASQFIFWSDYATSKPIDDIWKTRKVVRRSTLRRPNKVAMGATVWEDALANHPQIIERIKYTDRAFPATVLSAFASLIQVDEVRMSGAIFNSANMGATAVYNDVWGDDLLLFFNAPAPSLRSVSFGWTIEAGGGLQVRTKRDDMRDRDLHHAKHITAEKIVMDTAAYLLKDIVAP